MAIEDEDDIWKKVTSGVKPYAAKKEKILAAGNTAKKTPRKKAAAAKNNYSSAPLKAKTKRIDARLDLHGMCQTKAFSALKKFINLALKNNYTKLLIITGKGKEEEGVLRKMLPLWLEAEPFKNHIMSIEQASPQDGGAGAFYIKLKK